jgi:hypothetical protein
MADKVLPGASREALGFIAVHWKSLAKMSVIPFLAYLIVAIVQIRGMGTFYRAMGSTVNTNTINPNVMGAYMVNMAISILGSLIAMCLMGLLFAQIIRFHKTGVADWIMTDKAGIVAGLMTMVYSLGITMLTMLVYVGSLFGFGLVMLIFGGIAALIFGGSSIVGGIVGVIGFVSILGLLAGLYWFMFRFMVGLPGVALGSSPDFFKDMWPLSKGESWGLPLRMLLASLVAYVPLFIVLGIFAWPAIAEMLSKMPQQGSPPTPDIMLPIMADLMERMLPAMVAMMLVYIPFMWFTALLLGISFQRFRARN